MKIMLIAENRNGGGTVRVIKELDAVPDKGTFQVKDLGHTVEIMKVGQCDGIPAVHFKVTGDELSKLQNHKGWTNPNHWRPRQSRGPRRR